MRTDTICENLSIFASSMANGVSLPPPSGGYQVAGNPASSAYEGYSRSTNGFTRPPDYPDTSIGAYFRSGGKFPGFGYYAWRDKLVNDYTIALNQYNQWYDSAAQQRARIEAAGLNSNLAYGSVSPGSPGSMAPPGSSPSPSPVDIFSAGASIISGMFGNIKTLAEAANVVASLPESRFKGKLSKQLDVALAAGAINNQHGFEAQLNGARVLSGVGKSTAQKEQISNLLSSARDTVEQDTLEYLTTHDLEGSETDLEGSAFMQGRLTPIRQDALAYQKNKLEFDKLFSDSRYYQAVLDKMVNEATISKGQAYVVDQILKMDIGPDEKVLMLQGGLPGFLAKLSGMITSHAIETAKGYKPVALKGGEVVVDEIKKGWRWLSDVAKKSNKGKSPRQASKGVKSRDYPSNIYNH